MSTLLIRKAVFVAKGLVRWKSLLVDKHGPVTTIGINRPEKRNCINLETAEELRKTFAEFEDDPDTRVAVLHGIGGNFCAGYDLEEFSKVPPEKIETLYQHKDGTVGPTHRVLKKPVIGAVSGYAVAGGLELALWCDIRIVEDTAIMGVFCRRFGVPLVDGGTVRLVSHVGLSVALDLILTGRAVSGQEAVSLGLATRLTACGTALGQAVKLANSLVKFPQECMLSDRQSAYNAAYMSPENMQKLLVNETTLGMSVAAIGIQGAHKFAVDNVGRHGKFNIDSIPKAKSGTKVK